METLTKSYSVKSSSYSHLLKGIEKLNKRCKRLGMALITAVKTGETNTVVERKVIYDGNFVTRFFTKVTYQVEITGQAPRINGWDFVATLEHDHTAGDSAVIVRTVPTATVEIPANYRTCKPTCEHCNVLRGRKDTYLLHKTGEFKQVGRSCLKDFLSNANPHILAETATLWENLGELSSHGDGGSGMIGEDYQIYIRDFLLMCTMLIRTSGYVSRKISEEKGLATTSSWAWALLTRTDEEVTKALVALGEPTDVDFALVENALEWLPTAFAGRSMNDFEHNLTTLCSRTEITFRHTGIVASLLPVYFKAVSTPVDAKAPAPVSEWIGAEGARDTFVLTLEKVLTPSPDALYVSYPHLFVDDKGNRVTWFSSNLSDMAEGKTYTVMASVKKHDVYREKKVTLVTRCKVLGEVAVIA